MIIFLNTLDVPLSRNVNALRQEPGNEKDNGEGGGKMTQHELILDAFKRNGGRMTLGYILSHPWGYEFRARATELRRNGHKIILTRGKRPSDNLYELDPVTVKWDGAQSFFI